MRITLELPDDIQGLTEEEQREIVMQALNSVKGLDPETATSIGKMSKWAKLAQRVENDPDYSGRYFEQLKNDMKEFRGDFEFEHDN